MTAPTLLHGASWLLPDGTVLPVAGFHAEWIADRQDLVPGCDNVCDVVLSQGWISVAAYSEGYVELMIPSRSDRSAVERALGFLGANQGAWDRALVMTMDEEGYYKVTAQSLSEGRGLIRGTGAP